jgi:cohesin domain-containing protein
MRQQIGVALVLALLALTLSVKDSAPVLAGGGKPPVTLSLPAATTVNPGDTFTLPISLTMETDSHAISIVTLVLAFDPTVLKVTDFSPTDVFPAVLESSLGTDTAGLTAGIGMNPAGATKSSTTVATITFQAVGSGGVATPISFTRAEAYSLSAWDEAGENVVGSTSDTSVTISGQAKPPSCPTPTVTVNFSWGNFGDTITVQGGGWLPGGTVTITATGPTQFDLGSVPVPDSGAWSGNITVPEVPTGNYELVFSENHEGCEIRVTNPFIIVAQAATLDPTEGSPGTEVTVTGSGWPPGHKIAVKWRGTTLAETIADSNGNIQVFFTVPADAAAEVHEIDIKDAEAGMGGIDVHLPFTVTTPDATPPPGTTSYGSIAYSASLKKSFFITSDTVKLMEPG